MNSTYEIFAGGSIINVIGWTLLHFIWQAAAIAIVVLIGLSLTRKHSAACRYWICCLGLLAMVACPLVSASFLSSPFASAAMTTRGALGHSAVTVPGPEHATVSFGLKESPASETPSSGSDPVVVSANQPWNLVRVMESRLTRWLPTGVAIWLAGVLLHFIRLAAGIWRVQRWVAGSTPVVDFDLNQVFRKLCHRMTLGRRIQFLECKRTEIPAVAGIVKPVVLIPSSLLTGLSCREMELVLAHELAHVKRHDFLVNLLQKCAESMLFYHPAVWWISHRICVERENCCDDLAVDVCGDRIALAKALSAMESVRCAEEALVPAANGGILTQRIRRLLMLEPLPVQSAWPVGLVGILFAGIGLAMVTSFAAHAGATTANAEDTVKEAAKIPTVTLTQTDHRDNEIKPEILKADSRTGIKQRVFTNIRLQSRRDQETRETELDMKYSNVIPYSFIPARAAAELNAVKLGEIDFSNFKDAGRPTNVTWLIVPNDFVNPMGYIQDGVSHYFLDYLHQPTDQPIVPYHDDQFFAPDHLGFYGMNPTKQMRFDVVRISEVDLGIGQPFGPLNALVLDDENSDFGLLGSKWAEKVRGKKGGTLLHAAIGEFRIQSPQEDDPTPGNKRTKNQANQQPAEKSPDAAKKLPEFEVIDQNGRIRHIAVESIDVRRSPVDLLKQFSSTLQRHGPQKGISITNMESIVSANPTKRFDHFLEADEVTFNLPEGSKSRAAILGEVVEMKNADDSIEITVTNGKVQWIDSVGVVRAEASPDGGAEQLVISARIGNDEVVLNMKTQRIKPEPDYPNPPVQVTMNLQTGAPADEKQPPHGSIRYEVFEASQREDKPLRLKMKWRYDLDRLVKEAEKQTGKKWEALIWGVDAPRPDIRR